MKKCWFRQEWGMWHCIQSLDDLCWLLTDSLITKAIHEKHTHKEYIGVDACAVNLMRPAMYGAYHHITVLGKENEPCDHMYDVTGSLCENNDKFAIDRIAAERLTWEITWRFTIQERMASLWDITTMVSFVQRKFC